MLWILSSNCDSNLPRSTTEKSCVGHLRKELFALNKEIFEAVYRHALINAFANGMVRKYQNLIPTLQIILAFKRYITQNDILLFTHYGTIQIDHIVVSQYGIFVVETKNYKGWVFGHENSEEWKQSLLGKKRVLGVF